MSEDWYEAELGAERRTVQHQVQEGEEGGAGEGRGGPDQAWAVNSEAE